MIKLIKELLSYFFLLLLQGLTHICLLLPIFLSNKKIMTFFLL
jgi:hypothetical protein